MKLLLTDGSLSSYVFIVVLINSVHIVCVLLLVVFLFCLVYLLTPTGRGRCHPTLSLVLLGDKFDNVSSM